MAEAVVASRFAKVLRQAATLQQRVELDRGQARPDGPHERSNARNMRRSHGSAAQRCDGRRGWCGCVGIGIVAKRAEYTVGNAVIVQIRCEQASRGGDVDGAASIRVARERVLDGGRRDGDDARITRRELRLRRTAVACGGNDDDSEITQFVNGCLIGITRWTASKRKIDHVGRRGRHRPGSIVEAAGKAHALADIECSATAFPVQNP